MGSRRGNKIIGWIGVMALSFVPVILWAATGELAARFAGPAATMRSMGQLAGLAGMALFSLTFVLSTRLPVLERLFTGMNQVYNAHQKAGAIAFSLLLAHPALLALQYAATSTRAAAMFLLSTSNAILYGTIGLLLLMLLIVLTFFVNIAYDKWKLTHKFMGVAFLFAALHTLMISVDIKRNIPLRLYMITLILVATASILYRTVLRMLLVRRKEYTVEEVRELDDRTVEIILAPTGAPMRFIAGQFAFVGFDSNVIGKETHPFSMASSPVEDRISIVAKALGDYTGRLKLLEKGTRARLEGPFGAFSYERAPEREQIWIAGGIGITPFLSMAKSLPQGTDRRIMLYYCTTTRAEAIFSDTLQEIARTHPGAFSNISFCSDQEGRITAASIKAQTGDDIASKAIFICGPVPMMRSLRQQFRELGVPDDHIHSEEFAFR